MVRPCARFSLSRTQCWWEAYPVRRIFLKGRLLRSMSAWIRTFVCALCLVTVCNIAAAQSSATAAKERARDLGVPFDGAPGPLDAITDVKGVEVGQTTLISGDGPLKVGVGPVRTGVTVIL